MNKIKFRAWDKDGCYTKNCKPGMIEDIQGSTLWSSIIYDDDFELMQYTGLKDKNGKEIYEGDILQVLGYEPGDIIGNCFVEYGCFLLSEDDWQVEHKTMGFSGNWGDGCKCHCELNESKILRVIGNIYENPELLKEVKKK